MDATAKSIEGLANNIREFNKAYRNGTPIVPDAFYDQEVERLRQMDPENDWFKHIEPVDVKNSRKVKLPIPMKSLYKVKTLQELMTWCKSLGLNESFELVVTPKFDGLSLLHNEISGMTYSRGGSENEGQDCTPHYEKAGFEKMPSELMYTYGEFVFSKKSWEENFAGRVSEETDEKYKSPRNTAAGLLNREIPSELLKKVDFFRYGTDDASIQQFETYADFYRYVCKTFRQPYLYKVIKVGEITEDMLHALFNEWRDVYFIDGLVLYVNDIRLWQKMGRQATTGNPNYAIAYKNPNFTETYVTKVKDVSWAISKAGMFKPVVNIEVVDTGECEMENPTGYNARFIRENAIAPGAVVKVTRSGGVIPKILETVTPAPKEAIDEMFENLKVCPYCGSPVTWNDSGAELVCTNKDCKGKRLAEIVFFYNTVGVDKMGPEMISKIFNAGFDTLRKMLDITFDELMDIDGFGEETANIILANNQRIRQGVEATKLMQASNCFPGIGQVKATKILDTMSKEYREAFIKGYMKMPDLYNEDNVRTMAKLGKTAESFINGMQDYYDFMARNNLSQLEPVKNEVKVVGDRYAGMRVCFSGFRDKLLEEKIISEGGTIVSGVSKKTTHLVVVNKEIPSAKVEKAKKLGTQMLTIEEFLKL